MKSKNFHKKWTERWPAMFLSGLALALSFPPFPFPFVICIALIPLLRRWKGAQEWRTVYLDWTGAFLLMYFVTFSWPLRHDLSHVAMASLSGVLLLPMTSALAFAVTLPVKKVLGMRAGLVAGIASFLIIEWFWTHGPIAMPGTLLGNALSNQRYVNQIVDITGTTGLSLWILVINAAGLMLLDKSQARKHLLACFLFLWILTPFAYSAWQLTRPVSATSSTRIAMIQPGIPSTRWADETDHARVAHMIALTDSLLLNQDTTPDLVLWPETTVPGITYPTDSLLSHLQAWTASSGFALLTGAIIQTETGSAGARQTNSALLIDGATSAGRYDKNWLVPFAEHVPFEQTINQLSRLRVDAGGVAGYQQGDTQSPLTFREMTVGVIICFESLFGDYARQYFKNDVRFLVALSNIGWWGSGFGPTHYLNFSRLRAIETRSYFAINTVTGPAAIFDHRGKIIAESDWMERTLLVQDIPHATKKTIYTRFGDWLSILAILTAFFILIRYFFAKRLTST